MSIKSEPRLAVGHFELHLREAIALNRQRLPMYARLTDGASVPVSRQLIRLEQWSLPLARFVDGRAGPFQARGLAIVKDEFVSMNEVPPFADSRHPASPPMASRVSGHAIAWRVGMAFRVGGYEGAGQAIETELATIAAAPCFHCMLRHLLESALRIARLAPVHVARAAEIGLHSPASLSRLMLLTHLLGLGAAARLDLRAFPLQMRGIPILCQDVPPIPPGP